MRASAASQSALLIADIAGLPEARGVRYAVIGAMARRFGRETMSAIAVLIGSRSDP